MTKTNNTTTTRVKSRTEETREMETREEEYTFAVLNIILNNIKIILIYLI